MARVEVANVATPEDSEAAGPREVVPSKNLTVPVAELGRVAVKVTADESGAGLALEVSVIISPVALVTTIELVPVAFQ